VHIVFVLGLFFAHGFLAGASVLSFGNVAPMTDSARNLSAFLGLPAVAAITTFIMLLIATTIVSSLPRSMEGESVGVPWPVCIVGSFSLSILLPWLASLPQGILLAQKPRRHFSPRFLISTESNTGFARVETLYFGDLDHPNGLSGVAE